MPAESIAKKDAALLKQYVAKLNRFVKRPGSVAIRICECCIQLTMPAPDAKLTKKQRVIR